MLTACKALTFFPAMVWGTANINELREVEELRRQRKETFGCRKALRMSLMAINAVFDTSFLANLPFG